MAFTKGAPPGVHVEIIPPKQDSGKLEEDLALFASKFERVRDSGFTASITDNAMGLPAFQGHECIEELGLRARPDQVLLYQIQSPLSILGLRARPDQVLIHLNTFHTKRNLDEILESCEKLGITSILAISGDGSPRLPKLKPADVEAEGTVSVTSVEVTRYIRKHYPSFTVGGAFNPYLIFSCLKRICCCREKKRS